MTSSFNYCQNMYSLSRNSCFWQLVKAFRFEAKKIEEGGSVRPPLRLNRYDIFMRFVRFQLTNHISYKLAESATYLEWKLFAYTHLRKYIKGIETQESNRIQLLSSLKRNNRYQFKKCLILINIVGKPRFPLIPDRKSFPDKG